MVLDALGTERFDAGHGGAEVGEGLPVVFQAGVLYESGGQFGRVQIRVAASPHQFKLLVLI